MNHPSNWTRPEWPSNLPGQREIADLLGGVSGRSSRSTTLDALAVFGAGVLVGAGVALLLAPKEGHALREDLAKKLPGSDAPTDRTMGTSMAAPAKTSS